MNVKMGRKKTPAALKEILGNRGKRPLQPDLKLKGSKLPQPPAFLAADALAEWERIVAVLAPTGILTPLDAAALAVYCSTYATWKEASELLAEADLTIVGAKGHLIQNPLIRIANRAASDLVRYSSEFGLTPISRARIIVGTPSQDDNAADQFFE